MAMVDQEDVLNTFEGLTREIFKVIKGVNLPEFPRMKYDDAMRDYGIDKPDVRFDMKIKYLTTVAKGHGFKVFEDEEHVLALVVPGCAKYSKADIEKLTKLAKSGDIGAKHLIWCKHEAGGLKSSADKFFKAEALAKWADTCESKEGDLIVAVAGPLDKTRVVMGRLRLAIGRNLGLMDSSVYKPLWVLDFPLLEWDEAAQRWNSMHHPFTSPYVQHLHLLEKDPGAVRARAYDLVMNGVEVGGGSIRIHDRQMQNLIFRHLGMSEETARNQFGFLLRAFEYGAPPHGGMAFGLDRLISLLGEFSSIRDCIAFPKNNMGRDTMIKTPSPITDEQLKELSIKVDLPAPKAEAAPAIEAGAAEKKEGEP
jgi:aspartyl-tRNA synthetase